MPLEVKAPVREFRFGDKVLPDPGSHMTEKEVMKFYSGQYPELTNSNINGPEIKEDKTVFTFSKSVGVKG